LIYLDTSVVLAWLFAEDRVPPAAFWSQVFVSSRLLEYEVFNRVHARGAAASHAVQARQLVDRVNLIGLEPRVLARALQPFPAPARTLDALHLATLDFVRHQGAAIELATYDQRLAAAATAMGFALSAATR
jgi:predicted nucleic acid-binding protein